MTFAIIGYILGGILVGFGVGQWYGNRKAFRELRGIMHMAEYNAEYHSDPDPPFCAACGQTFDKHKVKIPGDRGAGFTMTCPPKAN
jgi:hypothetical protein